MKKILVAIPTNKYIEPETFKSIWDLDIPIGFDLDFQYFYGYQIDQIRNLIVEWGKKYDYLFSVDSDIILPKDTLTKLVNSDKDIISGLYIQRIPNKHTLEVYMDNGNGGCTNIPYELIKNINRTGQYLAEIIASGMGCCLIKSEVLRKMQYPHFLYKSALSHNETISEDVYFCLKARSLGFQVWMDSSIKCKHKGAFDFIVEEETHLEKIAKLDLLPKDHIKYIEDLKIEPKVIYDIGACVQHWTRHAKKRWPSSKYYLLDAAKSVQNFIQTDENVISVLSDRDGQIVEFYENTDNPGGNSYYKETTGFFTDDHKTFRTTLTLDTIIEVNGWQYPDLIKIDVQGAELDVLRGAKKAIQSCRNIIIECQHINYNEGAPQKQEVFQFLEDNGYYLVSEICKNENDGDYHFSKIDK